MILKDTRTDTKRNRKSKLDIREPRGFIRSLFIALFLLLSLSIARYFIALNPKEGLGAPVSLNLLTILMSLKNTKVVLVFLALSGIGYYIYRYLISQGYLNKAENNKTASAGDIYEISTSGSSGTARKASDSEIFGNLIISPNGVKTEGWILGYKIDEEKSKEARLKKEQELRALENRNRRAAMSYQTGGRYVPQEYEQKFGECVVTDFDRVIYFPKNPPIGNKNILCIGGSGAGKSYSLIEPMILQNIEMGLSMVITDTKGKLYERYAEFAKQRGYNVQLFNTVTPRHGSGFDPFKSIPVDDKAMMESRCQDLAESLLTNTGEILLKKDFWTNGQGALLTTLLIFIAEKYGEEDEKRTLVTLRELLEKTPTELSETFTDCPRAKTRYRMILKESRDTQVEGFMQGLSVKLELVLEEEALGILSHDDIQISKIGKEKTMVFVMIDDTRKKQSIFASVFFNLLMSELAKQADNNVNGTKRLDIETVLLLDEFGSYKILDFDSIISNFRARGIPIIMCIQDISQIEDNYGKNILNIIQMNCSTTIYLGGSGTKNEQILTFIEFLTGDTTAIMRSEGTNVSGGMLGYRTGERDTYSESRRKLYTANEIATLDPAIALVFTGHLRVFEVKKYPVEDHPDYRLLPEPGRVSDFLPDWFYGYKERSEKEMLHRAKLAEEAEKLAESFDWNRNSFVPAKKSTGKRTSKNVESEDGWKKQSLFEATASLSTKTQNRTEKEDEENQKEKANKKALEPETGLINLNK